MTDEPTGNEEPEGISEDDLRNIIGEVVEEKLGVVADTLNPANLLEGIKGLLGEREGGGDPPSDDSLLERIGTMIDEKLQGLGSGENGGKKEHVPKLKIFGS